VWSEFSFRLSASVWQNHGINGFRVSQGEEEQDHWARIAVRLPRKFLLILGSELPESAEVMYTVVLCFPTSEMDEWR